MSSIDTSVSVHCLAESGSAGWEAFCLEFDLAVQGGSFEEVYAKLSDQIVLFLETVAELPQREQQRLLRRRAPLSLTIPLVWRMIASLLLRRGTTPRHDYTMRLPRSVAA